MVFERIDVLTLSREPSNVTSYTTHTTLAYTGRGGGRRGGEGGRERRGRGGGRERGRGDILTVL